MDPTRPPCAHARMDADENSSAVIGDSDDWTFLRIDISCYTSWKSVAMLLSSKLRYTLHLGSSVVACTRGPKRQR